jgi:hypothetical protein
MLTLFICGAIACSSQSIAFADDDNDEDSDSGNYRRNRQNDDYSDDDMSRNSDDDEDIDDDNDDEQQGDRTRQRVEQTVDRLLNLGPHSTKSSLNLEPRDITSDIKRLQTGMKSLERRIGDYTHRMNPPWMRYNNKYNDDNDDNDEEEEDDDDKEEDSSTKTGDDSYANEQEDNDDNTASATVTKNKSQKSKKRRYLGKKRSSNMIYTVKNISEIGMPTMWKAPAFSKKVDNFAPFVNRYKNYGNYKVRDKGGTQQKSSTATTYRVKTYSGSTSNEIVSKYAGADAAYDHNQKHTVKNDYFKNPSECIDKSRC